MSDNNDKFYSEMGCVLDDEGLRVDYIAPPDDALILVLKYNGRFIMQPPRSNALDAPEYEDQEVLKLGVIYEFLVDAFKNYELLSRVIEFYDTYRNGRRTIPDSEFGDN